MYVAKLLLREEEGREHFGAAFSSRRVNDAATRALTRAIAFALPTERRLHPWGKSESPTCILCNSEPESFQHIQRKCSGLHGAITKAHDKAFESVRAVIEMQVEDYEIYWAQSLGTAFPDIAKKSLEPDIHQTAFKGLGLVKLTPDGIRIDHADKYIVVVELGRTDDDGRHWANLRKAAKELTYDKLCTILRAIYKDYNVTQCTLIAGIRGSIIAKEWEEQLGALELSKEIQTSFWPARRKALS